MQGVRFQAVLFDLLTALLDSWALWSQVAGSEDAGLAWRKKYLELTYQAGRYRPYEQIVRESAEAAGVGPSLSDELLGRWSETSPWPETPQVLKTIQSRVPVGVVTNCSDALVDVAVACTGRNVDVVVTCEQAGWYKPRPEPYLLALEKIGHPAASVLYVAGSPCDIGGAAGVGMPVYWHNRLGLASPENGPRPSWIEASLEPLLEFVR